MAGGGAAAAFQAGVLGQIDARKIKVDAVFGTSAGALNAAGYAFGCSGKVERLWLRVTSWRDMWALNYSALIGFGSGVMSSGPLRKKIDRVCEGKARIPCCVTRVDMTTGDLLYSWAGDDDFAEAVEASAALPGIISPVAGMFSDGGIREVCPLKKALDAGHDHISVILCHPSNAIEPWTVKTGFLGAIDAALRADSIRGYEVLMNDISAVVSHAAADVTIYEPEAEILGCLDFKRDKISAAIKAGYVCNGKTYKR
jgi:NTE family protein